MKAVDKFLFLVQKSKNYENNGKLGHCGRRFQRLNCKFIYDKR